ncbi:MAG TPA: MFS transporter [Candidatus Acidoferrum sp.]|nr:MFS transporter [Candidatus Acidoferrum sp.]
MTRRLFALSLSVALVMAGVGIDLPLLPLHVERLGLGGSSTADAALHVSLLAAGYALMHLLFAPLWGRLSDSIGRKPLLGIGLCGFAAGQVLCGLATSLVALYLVRLASGIFSSATLPAAFAYVADATGEEERTRGMAHLGGAAGLGLVVGPALGGLLAGLDVPAGLGLPLDNFALPFFAAAVAALAALFALRWVEEPGARAPSDRAAATRTGLAGRLGLPMAVAVVSQLAISLFDTTFALYARAELGLGLGAIGAVFVVCALVMLVVQLGAAAPLVRRLGEVWLLAAGLTVMGASLALLAEFRGVLPVLGLVAVFAIGIGLVAPTVSALTSRRGGTRVGAALGLETAARSLGQIAGPLIGGGLLSGSMALPYLLASALLLALALIATATVVPRRGGPGREIHLRVR